MRRTPSHRMSHRAVYGGAAGPQPAGHGVRAGVSDPAPATSGPGKRHRVARHVPSLPSPARQIPDVPCPSGCGPSLPRGSVRWRSPALCGSGCAFALRATPARSAPANRASQRLATICCSGWTAAILVNSGSISTPTSQVRPHRCGTAASHDYDSRGRGSAVGAGTATVRPAWRVTAVSIAASAGPISSSDTTAPTRRRGSRRPSVTMSSMAG
jgi:hypothetical protein